MKKRMLVAALSLLAFLIFGYVGYVVGTTWGGARAARSANTASLLYFTIIHKDLEAQEYDRAKKLVEMAVDGHVGVLRELDTSSSPGPLYAWPWTAIDPTADVRREVLRDTRDYFLALPGVLEPETREFLSDLNPAGLEG